MTDPFGPRVFERLADAPDPAFYVPHRFVTHLDEGAVAAVGPPA